MISHYPLLETAPFMEFTSVKVTDAFNHLFDIEKNTEENLQSYCQALINKILLTIIVVLQKIQLTG